MTNYQDASSRFETNNGFVRIRLIVILAALSMPLATPSVAQDTRTLIAPFLHLPPNIRLHEIVPEVFGSRSAEIRAVDAFTLPDLDRRTIFVNISNPLWKRAVAGDTEACFYRAVLASVIAHELFHLSQGASECAALQEELRVWRTFIRDGLVPAAEGLQRADRLQVEIRAARKAEAMEASGAPRRAAGERQ